MTTFEQNGHVQSGYRPAAVISNNVGNKFSPNVIVVPLTTADKNPYQPTHVPLSTAENGLREDSIALCENPMTIPKDALQGYCTHLTGDALSRIRVGMIASMALLPFLLALLSSLLKLRASQNPNFAMIESISRAPLTFSISFMFISIVLVCLI